MCPRSGSASANVASIEIAGSVLSTPKQFGPTHLIPYSRTFANNCLSASAPSAPVSLKPAVMIHKPFIPFAWH